MTVKYFITNNDSIIAIVHEDEKYGRIMVLNNCEINFNHAITIYDRKLLKKLKMSIS